MSRYYEELQTLCRGAFVGFSSAFTVVPLICHKPLDFKWQCLRNSLECIVAFDAFSSAFTVIPLVCHKPSDFEWQRLRNSLSCCERSSYQNETRSILKHRLFQNQMVHDMINLSFIVSLQNKFLIF